LFSSPTPLSNYHHNRASNRLLITDEGGDDAMGGMGGVGGDEFAQIRELLQNNPQMLPVLLNQLAQSQPEVRFSY
jgi:hypothetical protein